MYKDFFGERFVRNHPPTDVLEVSCYDSWSLNKILGTGDKKISQRVTGRVPQRVGPDGRTLYETEILMDKETEEEIGSRLVVGNMSQSLQTRIEFSPVRHYDTTV